MCKTELHSKDSFSEPTFSEDVDNNTHSLSQTAIHQLFEKKVEEYPNKIAIIFKDEQLTYSELNRKANQLAHYLRKQGIGPDKIVAICLKRSPEMLISILGILKAGGAYLPIDPDYPKTRIDYLLQDSQASVILTTIDLNQIHFFQSKTVFLNDWNTFSQEREDNPINVVLSDHLAYVIYTSGSTGQPKGVMVEHAQLINTITAQIDLFLLSDQSRVLSFSSFSFDAFISEVFSTFCVGATLVVISRRFLLLPEQFIQMMCEHKITTITLPPAFIMRLPDEPLSYLKVLVSAGEYCPESLIYKWGKQRVFINAYGPTESTICATARVYQTPIGKSTIGKPIQNVKCYVVDKSERQVLRGEIGELYIGGSGVSRGYLNRPKLTKKKFIDNPFDNGKVYKTGDLVRQLSNGEYEFVGRIDYQIKIRGFRVEPQEIEYHLHQLTIIKQAVVLTQKDKDGNDYLIAYCVSDDLRHCDATTIRQALIKTLPNYMLPSKYIFLKELPLTSNQKIDRQALAKLKTKMRKVTKDKPANKIERLLCNIWSKVLTISPEQISNQDDFFVLGGHSLLLIKVIFYIKSELNIQLDIYSLYQFPTIETLANHIHLLTKQQQVKNTIGIIRERNCFPLSYAQEQIWLHQQLAGDIPLFHETANIIFHEAIEREKLENAINTIINKHDVFRVCIQNIQENPIQIVQPFTKVTLPLIDTTYLPVTKRLDHAIQLATQDAMRSFCFDKDLLMRFLLVKLANQSYRLFMTFHHLIMDGVTINIFFNDLERYYHECTYETIKDSVLQMQYCDYVGWLKNIPVNFWNSDIEFWKKELFGISTLKMPYKKLRNSETKFYGACKSMKLSKTLLYNLEILSRKQGVSLFTTLFTAFNVLLYRYTQQNEIVVGTVVSVRELSETINMVGNFLNTLIIRSNLSNQPTFQTLLQSVWAHLKKIYRHQSIPFQLVLKQLNNRDRRDQLLPFQVSFIFEPEVYRSNAGWEISQLEVHTATSKYDLTFELDKRENGIIGRVQYNTSLFDDQFVDRMIRHYQILLKDIVENNHKLIDDLTILPYKEKEFLLRKCDLNVTVCSENDSLQSLFEKKVEEYPNKIAIIFKDEQLTYSELNRKANQLAHYLRKQGIGPDKIVAICLKRSPEMLISILGILKAGGAYLPIDPDYPKTRIDYLLQDSQASVILTTIDLNQIHFFQSKTVFLNDWNTFSQEREDNPINVVLSDHLAYVIYTSGSTGQPKGVMIEHQSILNHIMWFSGMLESTHQLVVDFSSSLSFDFSVAVTLMPVILGARIVICDQKIKHDPLTYLKYLKENHISFLKLVPSYFSTLLSYQEMVCNLTDVQYIVLGGEVLNKQDIVDWFTLNSFSRLIHEYGPTEATIAVTAFIIDQSNIYQLPNIIPIGKPAINTNILILDPQHHLCPVDIIGEICIGGVCVARGYLNRPKLTQERFVSNPYGNGRLYKTGDLGRYLLNGEIEFRGRKDNQIKIRGYRIELEEIESVLNSYELIEHAVVILKTNKTGQKRLIAYVIGNAVANRMQYEDYTKSCEQYLKQHLPTYMLPNIFIRLNEVPRLTSGKIDRRALMERHEDTGTNDNSCVAPRTTIEKHLKEIWSELLGVNAIGIYDNFFQLGGDSITSIQLVSKARKKDIYINVQQVFENPTIVTLAQIAMTNSINGRKVIKASEKSRDHYVGKVPLLPIQKWFFEQNFDNPNYYNQGMLLKVKQRIDVDLIKTFIEYLVDYHEVLKFRYKFKNGQWIQYACDSKICKQEIKEHCNILDLSHISNKEQEDIVNIEATKWHASINIENGPIFIIKLINYGDMLPQRLAIISHHLIIDAISWRILIDDLNEIYNQLVNNKIIVISNTSGSYRDWSLHLSAYSKTNDLIKEEEFWSAFYKKIEIPLLGLQRKTNMIGMASISSTLKTKLTTQMLSNIYLVNKIQVIDLLLTALVCAMKDFSDDSSIYLMLEGHGRESLIEDLDLTNTVGWFTTKYPVYFNLPNDINDIDLVMNEVKKELNHIPHNGIGYGLIKYLSKTSKMLNQYSKPKIQFNYLGQLNPNTKVTRQFTFLSDEIGLSVGDNNNASFILSFDLRLIGNKLNISLSYDKGYLDACFAKQLLDRYIRQLQCIIKHCLLQSKSYKSHFKQALLKKQDNLMNDIELSKEEMQDNYYLSPMQESLLFRSLYHSYSDEYVVHDVYELGGKTDVRLLKKALNLIIMKYDVLRSSFVWKGLEKPIQVVSQSLNWQLNEKDWTDINKSNQMLYLKKFVRAERKILFDISKPPLFKLTLIKINAKAYYLIFCYHHIILDGWSSSIVINLLMNLYNHILNKNLLELKNHSYYKRYINYIQDLDIKNAQEFWNTTLQGFRRTTYISPHDVSLNKNNLYSECIFSLSHIKSTNLSEAAHTHGVTVNSIIHAAWSILLSLYLHSKDILYGVTLSGRTLNLEEIDVAVGVLINTLPIRMQLLKTDESILTFLKNIQNQILKLHSYTYVPLSKIQTWSQLSKKQQLFDHILVFENYIQIKNTTMSSGLSIKKIKSFEKSEYKFVFIISPGNNMEFTYLYKKECFDARFIHLLKQNFLRLLELLTSNISNSLFSVLEQCDKNAFLVPRMWYGQSKRFTLNRSIIELFEEQAQKNGTNTALIVNDRIISYEKLNQKASQLAHYLVKQGVHTETLVGVMFERSFEAIVSMLAVLKSGGAYVPIDPTYPEKRIRFMLEDAGISILLTERRICGHTNYLQGLTIHLDCKETSDALAHESTDNLKRKVKLNHLAYVIYTSGSTGQPKGVMVEHGNLLNSCKARISYYHKKNINFLHLSSLSFDSSLAGLFGTFLQGGMIVFLDQLNIGDLTIINDNIIKYKISHLLCTPSLYTKLLLCPGLKKCAFMQTIIVAGESSTQQLVNLHARMLPKTFLYNEYGPTECTVWSTVKRLYHPAYKTIDQLITIGRPISNVKVYILDELLKMVPIGVIGELYIGGANVARGYLNRPELTQERFISNPYGEGRLYKTGDLGRYLPNGEIEFRGRKDNQVKIRGYRIELEEIEAILHACKFVLRAVVILREKKGEHRQLISYLVKRKEAYGIKDSEFIKYCRNYLKNRIPSYMLPSIFICLDDLPLLPNGKIDNKVLSMTTDNLCPHSNKTAEPSTTHLRKIANIWSKILHIQNVGIYDDFFVLGGHSLLAISLISRLQREFNITLSIKDIFEYPILSDLSQVILDRKVEKKKELILTPQKKLQKIPLSFEQERIWLAEQLYSTFPLHNIINAIYIKGPLSKSRLTYAFKALIQKHQVLQMGFFIGKNIIPYQKVINHLKNPLQLVDLRKMDKTQQHTFIKDQIIYERECRFDLSRPPLMRCKLLQLSDKRYVLLSTIHHIITDAWSNNILFNDLARLYADLKNNTEPRVKRPVLTYSDYVIWQKARFKTETLKEQLTYWKQELLNIPKYSIFPSYNLIKDSTSVHKLHTYSIIINDSLFRKLSEFVLNKKTTLCTVMLAAFNALLFLYAKQETLVIGLPITNRNNVQLEGLMGFFINILPLRTDIKPNMTFLDLLEQIRERMMNSYIYSDVPFSQLVQNVCKDYDLLHHPIFQIIFVYQHLFFQTDSQISARANDYKKGMFNSQTRILNIKSNYSNYNFVLSMNERIKSLSLSFEYNPIVYDKNYIINIANNFLCLLQQVVLHPTEKILRLSCLHNNEYNTLLKWSGADSNLLFKKTINQLFEEQAQKNGTNTALIVNDRIISYEKLNQKANQLAHYLVKQGVHTETLVGVMFERSFEAIVSMLAVLKSGGAYVPIDPTYPEKRIRFMLEDAGISILLTERRICGHTNYLQGLTIHLDCKETSDALAHESTDNLKRKVKLNHLAYVIYTSGSTGQPKGVMVEHGNLLNSCMARNQYYDNEMQSLLLILNISFDAGNASILWPLLVGKVLVISNNALDEFQLMGAIKKYKVSHIICTPTLYSTILQHKHISIDQLHTVILGGEQIGISLVGKHKKEFPKTFLYNEYGPTECTVWSTVKRLYHPAYKTIDQLITIGRPISNVKVYILDELLKMVPIGVIGELYIGGANVARGYLNRPELTQERFISNPYGEGRLYKTGDLGRYLPNGEIEFRGRKDNQVKIRGYRVELEEIESLVNLIDGVKKSVVIAKEATHNNTKSLFVFINIDQHGCWKELIHKINIELSYLLPSYMIPNHYIQVKKMPYLPGGKVDKQLLLASAENFIKNNIHIKNSLPRNRIEVCLLTIWKEIIHINSISIYDNFFDIGGNSLSAIRLVSKINKTFLTNLSLTEFLDAPRIVDIVNKMDININKTYSNQVFQINAKRTGIPIFFIHASEGLALHYNILKKYISNIPLYGINNPYLGASKNKFNSIEEMASFYIKIIKRIHKKGPFYLAGHSFGGAVAYEMAYQLRLEKDKVKTVMLFDTYNISEMDISDVKLKDVGKVIKKLGIKPNSIEGMLLRNEIRNNDYLYTQYKPKSYRGKIVLFKAQKPIKGKLTLYKDKYNGWKTVCDSNLTVLTANGSHNTLFLEQNVQQLAALVESIYTEK